MPDAAVMSVNAPGSSPRIGSLAGGEEVAGDELELLQATESRPKRTTTPAINSKRGSRRRFMTELNA
jgi:hypothetical protein